MNSLEELVLKVNQLNDLESLEISEDGQLDMNNYGDYSILIEKIINFINARLISYKKIIADELKTEIQRLANEI